MTGTDLRTVDQARQALAEAEARLVMSAATCSAKAKELSLRYHLLDFERIDLIEREMRAEKGRLQEARLDADVAAKRLKTLKVVGAIRTSIAADEEGAA